MRLSPSVCFGRLSTLALALLVPLAPSFAAEPSSALLEEGRNLFLQGAIPACAICHTLEAAGTTGAIGPVLDELKPDAPKIIRALKQGVGAMPSYDGKLTDQQMSALAEFIVASTDPKR